MLWKYGVAWGCSWFALLAVALITTSISTKGNRKVFDWDAGKALRLFVLIGIATGAIVAVVYQHAEKRAVRNGKGLLEGHVCPRPLRVGRIARRFGGVRGWKRMPRHVCAALLPTRATRPPGKQCLRCPIPAKRRGCLRNTKDGTMVLNRHKDPTVKCTKDAPCVCVDRHAECKRGACHVPWRLPTWGIAAIVALVVVLLIAFRRQLVLGARLLGLAVAGKA